MASILSGLGAGGFSVFLVDRASLARSTTGRALYVEDFAAVQPGMWNDGVGSASRDCNIMFNGRPTLKLDPQGQVASGATNPGRTAATSGVVVKRRIHDGFRHKFGIEFWFRMSSTNLTAGTAFFSASIYNRDGTNAWHSRVYFNPNGNNQPMLAQILDGAATAAASGTPVYTTVATSVLQNGAGSHTYNPAGGGLDRAGGWHWCKLVADFTTKKYVSLQFDGETVVDLSAYSMDQTATTGFAGMHHSFEFSASTSTRPRYVHLANLVGTVED
jgi:hypothetical protein